jgi:pyruvyltransferase
MFMKISLSILFSIFFLSCTLESTETERPILYWYSNKNFGDYLSKIIVEKMAGCPVKGASLSETQPILFAVGSILRKAREGDIVWGSGFREDPLLEARKYHSLDVRAVRGPRTRQILLQMGIKCPEVYGDPALLLPYLFPEYKKQEPIYEYIVIPHHSESKLFGDYKNVVYQTEPWYQILDKVLKSKLVISSSLHGIIVAEAFGVPARLLKISWNEKLLKYQDYYEGTGRPNFCYANSVHEALQMGGEKPININLEPLMNSFPYDYFK